MNNIKIIFGSPGCGKTTYLINLLEKLLECYGPEDIAFVSFTRKGSYEGRDRAIMKFGYDEKDFKYFRTLHSIAFRELELSKYDVVSKRHYKEFSKAMGMNFVGYYTEDFTNNDDKYLFLYGLKRNNFAAFGAAHGEYDHNIYGLVEKNFIRYKHEMGLVDFTDMLMSCVDNDISLPVKVAIIDEAQDLTTLQWEFCSKAFRGCEKVFIAGDDDQSIYEWSGADIGKFLGLGQSCEKEILEKTYRLKENILNFSNDIVVKIKNRVQKQVQSLSGGGGVKYISNLEEIPINNEETYYFLSRNNYYLPEYKQYLMSLGIVFDYKGKPSIDKKLYDAIRMYEYLRKYDPDKILKNPVLTMLVKKECGTDKPWFEAFDIPLVESNYFRDIFKNKTDIDVCKIHINTIHGVKGGEADNVVLRMDITKNVDHNIDYNTDAELRCLYVAVTRAKKNVYILNSKSKFDYGRLLNS